MRAPYVRVCCGRFLCHTPSDYECVVSNSIHCLYWSSLWVFSALYAMQPLYWMLQFFCFTCTAIIPSCLQLFLLYESVSETLPKEGVPYDVATCETMIASFEATQKQTRSATYECKEAILSLKERMQEATITAKRGGIILDYFKAGSFLEKKTAEIDKKLEEVEAVMSRRETLLNLILKMRNFELQARKVGVLSMPAFCLAVIRVTACVLHQ